MATTAMGITIVVDLWVVVDMAMVEVTMVMVTMATVVMVMIIMATALIEMVTMEMAIMVVGMGGVGEGSTHVAGPIAPTPPVVVTMDILLPTRTRPQPSPCK